MFKNLLGFWRGKDFLSQVLDDFKQMLDCAESLFVMVSQALLENNKAADLKDKVYKIDKQINRLERGIRKRIIGHLSLQPTVNTSLCLRLMSVVKDAERLGDYAKNLYEVLELLAKPIDRKTFEAYFNDIDKDILTLFQETEEAFVQEDGSKAKSTFRLESRLVKE